jgi:hypothetical protein
MRLYASLAALEKHILGNFLASDNASKMDLSTEAAFPMIPDT